MASLLSSISSLSESLSLSGVGSHLTRILVRQGHHHPCKSGCYSPHPDKSAPTFRNCSLVCYNCLPRAFYCLPLRDACPFLLSAPLLSTQLMPLLLGISQLPFAVLAIFASPQWWQHDRGLSFPLGSTTLLQASRIVGNQREFQGHPPNPVAVFLYQEGLPPRST